MMTNTMKSHKLHCKFSKQNQIHKKQSHQSDEDTHHSPLLTIPRPIFPFRLFRLFHLYRPFHLFRPETTETTETSDTGIDKKPAHLSNMMSQLFRVRSPIFRWIPFPWKFTECDLNSIVPSEAIHLSDIRSWGHTLLLNHST